MSSSSPMLFERARVASLSRDRGPDDPELIEAKRNLRALMLETRVRTALAADPPLSPEHIERIMAVLAGGGR